MERSSRNLLGTGLIIKQSTKQALKTKLIFRKMHDVVAGSCNGAGQGDLIYSTLLILVCVKAATWYLIYTFRYTCASDRAGEGVQVWLLADIS